MQVDLRQGRGVLEADPGRDREQLADRHGDLLRIPTAGEQGADLVPDGPAVDAVAELRDTPAHLETRVGRRAGRRVVVPLSLHDVRPVDPGGDHLDDHLTGPGHRVGHVVEDERVGSTGLRERDRLHGSTLRRAAASASGVSTSRASALLDRHGRVRDGQQRAGRERRRRVAAGRRARRRSGRRRAAGSAVRRRRRRPRHRLSGRRRRAVASVPGGVAGERHVAGEDDDQVRLHQRQSGGDRGDGSSSRGRLPRPSDRAAGRALRADDDQRPVSRADRRGDGRGPSPRPGSPWSCPSPSVASRRRRGPGRSRPRRTAPATARVTRPRRRRRSPPAGSRPTRRRGRPRRPGRSRTPSGRRCRARAAPVAP